MLKNFCVRNLQDISDNYNAIWHCYMRAQERQPEKLQEDMMLEADMQPWRSFERPKKDNQKKPHDV